MKQTWIKQRIKAIGVTQNDLGDALELSASQISQIVNGKRIIQAREVPTIASFLKMKPADVLIHIEQGA